MNIPKYLFEISSITQSRKRAHTVDPSDALKASEIGGCDPIDVVGKSIPLDEITEMAGFRSALLPYGLSLRSTSKGRPIVRDINGLPTQVAILCYARGSKPGTGNA